MSFFARVTKRASTPESKNTVIMGRKTYESIPKKFRPLQGRKNLVVTRTDATGLQERLRRELDDQAKKADVTCVTSLRDAVKLLKRSGDSQSKAFIIGGSQMYKTALEETYHGTFTHLRILQTEIERLDGSSLEIDTFFPANPKQDGSWRRAENREVADWVGEEVPQVKSGDGSWKEDGDFKIRTLGWEKELPFS
ncbi:putative dihydrofolate [Phaeomoniella chlamydospora]|uniref:Dihydrofolate reductase n=1 Tax=Phaeomoniella chlamydospora TaxID=158046 RepID=A0A0G2FTE4_PHACM|nr:putative dihydrofolate [Phaeomoniella chlamydospora]